MGLQCTQCGERHLYANGACLHCCAGLTETQRAQWMDLLGGWPFEEIAQPDPVRHAAILPLLRAVGMPGLAS
jgi:hypothetical protein